MKIQNKCSVCQMRSENFFCNLSEPSMQIFESLKTTNSYPKGARIFVEGQPSRGIYMLCQGRVKLSTSSKDGKVIILHIAEPGEVLGLNVMASGSPQIATAEAIEPCQVNYVRIKDFLQFLEQNTEASMNAVKQLSQNYHAACLQICSLGLSVSVADKLATLFLGWCKANPQDGGDIRLKITYTHEELAQMIGTSRETVTRTLNAFRKRGLIAGKGCKWVIYDKKKLEAIIGTRTPKQIRNRKTNH